MQRDSADRVVIILCLCYFLDSMLSSSGWSLFLSKCILLLYILALAVVFHWKAAFGRRTADRGLVQPRTPFDPREAIWISCSSCLRLDYSDHLFHVASRVHQWDFISDGHFDLLYSERVIADIKIVLLSFNFRGLRQTIYIERRYFGIACFMNFLTIFLEVFRQISFPSIIHSFLKNYVSGVKLLMKKHILEYPFSLNKNFVSLSHLRFISSLWVSLSRWLSLSSDHVLTSAGDCRVKNPLELLDSQRDNDAHLLSPAPFIPFPPVLG